jgi:hypothetical protein
MTSPKPTRQQADLADVLELVLDKGIVVNADIAITVNQTELLGVEIRAAIASFETAAKYGLAFPSGTDMERVAAASGREELDGEDTVDLGIGASEGGSDEILRSEEPPQSRPDPTTPGEDDDTDGSGSESTEQTGEQTADETDDQPEDESTEEAAPEATSDTEEGDG